MWSFNPTRGDQATGEVAASMLKGHMKSGTHGIIRIMAATIAAILATMTIIVAVPAWAATCEEKHFGGGVASKYDLGKDCTLHIGAGNLYSPQGGIGGEDLEYVYSHATSVILDSPKETKAPENSSWLFRFPLATSVSGLGDLDVSGASNFSGMLQLPVLTSPVNLSGWDTSKAVNMSSMFSNESYYDKGDNMAMFSGITSFKTTNVTSFESMFAKTTWDSDPHISGWDTSHAETMESMFNGATFSSSGIDLSGWKTQQVTTMKGMFQGSKGGDVKGLDTWKTSSVTNFGEMFQGVKRTTTANLSGWDTSHATAMNSMFSNADIDHFVISGFKVSSVKDFSHMFAYTNITSPLDLRNWKTDSAESMRGMFEKVTGIDKVLGLDGFNVSSVNDFFEMFASLNNPLSVDLSKWNTSSATNTSGMFASVVFGPGSEKIASWDMSHVTDMSSMFSSSSTLAGTEINLSQWNTKSANDMSGMFFATDLSSIYGIEGLDTGSVTDFSRMFMYAKNITRVVNMSEWDTSSASDMSEMFDDDDMTNLVGYQNWDMSTVTNTSSMFLNSTFTNPVDLSGWKTVHVTDMSEMFSWVNNFDMVSGIGSMKTDEVRNMSLMFSSTKGSNLLDLSSWDTSKVTNMKSMFAGSALNLRGLDKWKTSAVTSMSGMFSGADLKNVSINISGWDTASVKDMSYMFSSLDLTNGSIKGFESFNVSSVVNFQSMFEDAKINLLDMYGWKMGSGSINYKSMMYSGHIGMIRIGPDTRFDETAFTLTQWGKTKNIWDSGLLPHGMKVLGTWSAVPDDRTDVNAYWTSTGKKDAADTEMIARSREHPGTYARTTRINVAYYNTLLYSGENVEGIPEPETLYWPTTPRSDLLSTSIPTSKNFAFQGWSTSKDGPVEYAPGDPIDHVTNNDDDWVNLYTKWARILRKIHFDGDGAISGMPDSRNVSSGHDYTIPDNIPVRPGFTFIGWVEKSDQSVIYQPGEYLPSVSSDMNFRAIWRADPSKLPDASSHANIPLIVLLVALAVIALAVIVMETRRHIGHGHARHAA